MIYLLILAAGLIIATPALTRASGKVTTSTASGFRPLIIDRLGTKELEQEAKSGNLSAGAFISGAQTAFAPARAAISGAYAGAIAGIATVALGAIAASGEKPHWKIARVTLAQALELARAGAAEYRNGNKVGREKVVSAVDAVERSFINAPDFVEWLSIQKRVGQTLFLSAYFRKYRIVENVDELAQLERGTR